MKESETGTSMARGTIAGSGSGQMNAAGSGERKASTADLGAGASTRMLAAAAVWVDGTGCGVRGTFVTGVGAVSDVEQRTTGLGSRGIEPTFSDAGVGAPRNRSMVFWNCRSRRFFFRV